MESICSKLKRKRLLVSDGAWGTFLMRAGLKSDQCAELWNIEHPEIVRDIAVQYVSAGADLVTTNSFGGSRFKLDHFGLVKRAEELNKAAARLSREAIGPDGNVIASIGPTGKMLLAEDVTETELYDSFAEQAVALEAGGADACCIETQSALDEAILAIRAAKENTKLEIVCTFTYMRKVDDVYRTMMGVSPHEMAKATLEAGADIIGTNCSLGPGPMIEIARALREAAPGVPILVHPNAGLPVHTDDGDRYPETPESMAAKVHDLVDAGAVIIGGCCGTNPGHIRAIAEAVRHEISNTRGA